MKVYGDLFIRGSRLALEQFIVALEHRLADGWTRRFDRESEVRARTIGRMYCFARAAKEGLPASDLWMASRDGELYVSNILAAEYSSLTFDQYNAILREFFETCVLPAAADANVEAELGNTEPRIEDYLSRETTEQLRNFSALANRSVHHPYDRKRWHEFLASAYREGARLSSTMLETWLVQDERWPEDEASRLAAEYEQARDLLEVFQSTQA